MRIRKLKAKYVVQGDVMLYGLIPCDVERIIYCGITPRRITFEVKPLSKYSTASYPDFRNLITRMDNHVCYIMDDRNALQRFISMFKLGGR